MSLEKNKKILVLSLEMADNKGLLRQKKIIFYWKKGLTTAPLDTILLMNFNGLNMIDVNQETGKGLFPVDEFLTVEEVAKMYKLSPSTIRGYVFEKTIPYIKMGSGKKSPIRFNRNDLNEWIRGMSQKELEPSEEVILDNREQKNPKTSTSSLEKFDEFLKKLE